MMNKVIDAVKTAGVKENETGTSSFNISPNYSYSQPSDTTIGKITGFTVSNLIQIQSTNIGNVSIEEYIIEKNKQTRPKTEFRS